MHHIERLNDIWAKNANKIWEYWKNVHYRIVKLGSGGQLLPVI